MAHRLPTSFLPPRALAPILTVTFGVAALLEAVASADAGNAHGFAGVLTAPVIGTTIASMFAARRQVLPFLVVAFLTILTQGVGATLLFHGQFLWQLGVSICVAAALAAFVAMMPIFVLSAWLGRRDDADADLEAGDLLLGGSATVFTIVNLVVAVCASGTTTNVALLGALFGYVLFMAAMVSGVRRRRWLAKIRIGAVPGLRVREVANHQERDLPAAFGRREYAPEVLVETSTGVGTAYRGEGPDVPLLTVPA